MMLGQSDAITVPVLLKLMLSLHQVIDEHQQNDSHSPKFVS